MSATENAVVGAHEKPVAGKKNTVEVATLVLQIVTFVFLVAGQAWLYAFFGRERNQLELRDIAVRVSEAESKVVTVTGEILAPQNILVRENVTYSLRPVVIRIANDGKLPIHVEDVRLRAFVGSLQTVAKFDLSPKKLIDAKEIVPVSHEQQSAGNSRIGIIELKNDNWIEVLNHSVEASMETRKIPRAESRQVIFHLLVPHTSEGNGFSDQLQRVSVTVTPAKNERWNEQTWMGFVDRNFCVPEAFPPNITTDEPAAPPVLPLRSTGWEAGE
jgi:hypothetical protein